MMCGNDYPKAAGVFFDHASGVTRRQYHAGRMDLRCHKSTSSSASNAAQNTQTVSGAGSPSTMGTRSPATSGSHAVVAGGAVDQNNGGYNIKTGGALTITTTTDLGAVQGALGLANSAIGAVASGAAGSSQALSDLLASQLASQQNTASGGAATSSKTFLVTIGLIVAAALAGVWLWKRKKE